MTAEQQPEPTTIPLASLTITTTYDVATKGVATASEPHVDPAQPFEAGYVLSALILATERTLEALHAELADLTAQTAAPKAQG